MNDEKILKPISEKEIIFPTALSPAEVITDYFDGGGAVLPGLPIKAVPSGSRLIRIAVSDMMNNSWAGAHHVLLASLFIPQLSPPMFVPVACFTDDSVGWETGRDILRRTPVWWPRPAEPGNPWPQPFFNNFFLIDRGSLTVQLQGNDNLRAELTLADSQLIALHFEGLPAESSLHRLGDLSFYLPSIILDFLGSGEFNKRRNSYLFPSGWKVIETTDVKPAFVTVTIGDWTSDHSGNLWPYVGEIYKNGQRDFFRPPI